MSVNYEWKVERIEAYPEKDGLSNVVFNIIWRVNANEDKYNSTAYGSQVIYLNKDDKFIPYENLTKDVVLSWLKSSMGDENVAIIEENLLKQIENLKNPPIVDLLLPWDDGVNDRFFG